MANIECKAPVLFRRMYFPFINRTVEIHAVEDNVVAYTTWLDDGTDKEFNFINRLPIEYFNLHVTNIWGTNANLQH